MHVSNQNWKRKFAHHRSQESSLKRYYWECSWEVYQGICLQYSRIVAHFLSDGALHDFACMASLSETFQIIQHTTAALHRLSASLQHRKQHKSINTRHRSTHTLACSRSISERAQMRHYTPLTVWRFLHDWIPFVSMEPPPVLSL